MEIRGDEFIKNLEIEKEKVRLQEQTDSLNAQKQQTLFKSSDENIEDKKNNTSDEPFIELNDIILENNNNNKQKYIIFGFALVLLFLITIITIRLVQEPKTQEDFTSNDYIEEVVPKQMHETKQNINNKLDIDKIEQSEEEVKTIEVEKPIKKTNSSSDVFGIENKTQANKTTTLQVEENTKVEKEVIKVKEIVKKPIAKTITKSNILENKKIKEVDLKEKFSNNKKGYFIQVGAFTKNIDKKLIRTLNKSKYNYIQHKMIINGRTYNKVLVGSYKSSNDAQKDLSDVRKLVHNSKAYIMRLK